MSLATIFFLKCTVCIPWKLEDEKSICSSACESAYKTSLNLDDRPMDWLISAVCWKVLKEWFFFLPVVGSKIHWQTFWELHDSWIEFIFYKLFSFFADDFQTAQLQSLILELLTFCVEYHAYHIKNYIISKDLLRRVLVLLKSGHAFVALGREAFREFCLRTLQS